MVPHHPNLRSLRDSATAGCDLCQLIWTSIQQQNPEVEKIDAVLTGQSPDGEPLFSEQVWLRGSFMDTSRGREPRGSANVSQQDGGSQVYVDCGNEENPETTMSPAMLTSTLWVFADPGTPAGSRFVERYISADRNSDGYVEFGRAMLSVCRKRHPECGPVDLDAAPEMPTRVLDIGTSSGDSIKLVYARLHGLRKPYLALSYCWGQGVRHATELRDENISSLLESIDEAALTASHQECIAIARHLGIQYVWIDSLCIIQGNADDWNDESKLMAEVYGNATLTVVASRSADSRSGFVTNQHKQATPPCALPFGEKDESGKDIGPIFLYLPRAKTLGPLNTRGWCFQEGILSRRKLVFEMEKICFSCQRTTRWEDGTADESDKLRARLFQSITDDNTNSNTEPQALGQDQLRTEMLRLWYKSFLVKYTQRQLTNPNDIFAAISGIAQLAQQSIKSRYLAGIWEVDIVAGLLWNTWYSFGAKSTNYPITSPMYPIRPKRPTDLDGKQITRAPSWSWASIIGQVHERSTPRDEAVFRDPSNFLVRPCDNNNRTPPRWTASDSPHCDTNILHMPACELRFLGRPKPVKCRPTWSEVPGLTRKWHLQPGRRRKSAEEGYLVLLEPAESEQAQLDELGLLPKEDTPNPNALVFAEAFFDISEERPGITDCWFLPLLKEKWVGLLLSKSTSDGKFRRLGIVVVARDQFLPWVLSGPEEEIRLV
ncbi:HET-domain-containing protein [Hypoxylon trugodes]|uniref:HET-domain-containing protein n=1 Tax=Hypoxylon trugodes TaxID=326681 RepID=UPI002198F65B|nr:HET-domain-containing protein [Hypoxylon trugodes]KAI1386154.1 HET-domain-containing protein [Hypoxylon trugodes]